MKHQALTKLESMSDVLNCIRRNLGLTQEELAIRLETSQSSITHWETKKRKPMFTAGKIKLLLEVMKEAGLSLNDLPNE